MSQTQRKYLWVIVWPSDPWINTENLKMDIINIVNPVIKIAELENFHKFPSSGTTE